jgi:hypothetical protein
MKKREQKGRNKEAENERLEEEGKKASKKHGKEKKSLLR